VKGGMYRWMDGWIDGGVRFNIARESKIRRD